MHLLWKTRPYRTHVLQETWLSSCVPVATVFQLTISSSPTTESRQNGCELHRHLKLESTPESLTHAQCEQMVEYLTTQMQSVPASIINTSM